MIPFKKEHIRDFSTFPLGADFIDPDDPTYIAENELFNAAQSIELAAKKLSMLKPRRKPKVKLYPFLSMILHGIAKGLLSRYV